MLELKNISFLVDAEGKDKEIIRNVSAEAEEAYSKAWTEFKDACD